MGRLHVQAATLPSKPNVPKPSFVRNGVCAVGTDYTALCAVTRTASSLGSAKQVSSAPNWMTSIARLGIPRTASFVMCTLRNARPWERRPNTSMKGSSVAPKSLIIVGKFARISVNVKSIHLTFQPGHRLPTTLCAPLPLWSTAGGAKDVSVSRAWALAAVVATSIDLTANSVPVRHHLSQTTIIACYILAVPKVASNAQPVG